MTIRASICLAAITGTLGLFSIGSAHADSRLGAALKTTAPIERIVATVGYEGCCEDRRARRYRAHRHHERQDEYRDRRDDGYRRNWVHKRHWWRHRHAHDGDKCCRYHRKRHVRRHYPRYPRPIYGRNYEIYTYRRVRPVGPRTDVQWIYGRYRGYYYPYPYYPGAGY
jgi:hypothetical protein